MTILTTRLSITSKYWHLVLLKTPGPERGVGRNGLGKTGWEKTVNNMGNLKYADSPCYKVYFVQVGENGLGKTGWENGLGKTGWEKTVNNMGNLKYADSPWLLQSLLCTAQVGENGLGKMKLVQVKNGLGKMKFNCVLRRCDRCNYMMLEQQWTHAQIWKWTLHHLQLL